MYILQLNDMRSSQIEVMTTVCRAATSEELLQLMENHAVDGYRDGNWHKEYKKGGPLEWFNPPWNISENIIYVGSEEEWVRSAKEDYNNRVMTVIESKYI